MNLEVRREREKQERRESILNAAEKVFFSKGFDRCSMEEIAREAQLSRALLYVYFKDKAAMLRAIVLRALESLRERFATAIEAHGTGLEQIAAIGRAYYDFSREQSDYFDVMTQSASFSHLLDADAQSEALQICGNDLMQLMVQALETGIADGTLSPERVREPLMTAFFLRGAVHGVIMETRLPSPALAGLAEPDRLIRHTLDMLSHAMRADTAPRR
jgi:AcrR family transcriptional regulator